MGQYTAPDYYLLDELISEEHLLIRDSVRQWVNNELMPVIEDHAQRAEFPERLLPGMAQLGLFGPTIPEAYGGAGLDYLTWRSEPTATDEKP